MCKSLLVFHTDLCSCGETQMTSHIVESCPLTKLNGGLSRLHSADEDAVSWLTSYGSWNAYEKKKYSIVTMSVSRTICKKFVVKLCRDLKIWVISHSGSFKMVLFKSFGTVFYLPSMVTDALSCIMCKITQDIGWKSPFFH